MHESRFKPIIPQIPKYDSNYARLSSGDRKDSRQLEAQKQLAIIDATRNKIRLLETQANEAVVQLTEKVNAAEKLQARSKLMVWVHESIATSGKLNILQFKSGTYVSHEERGKQLADLQGRLAKATDQQRYIQENKDTWVTMLDARRQFFALDANAKHSEALKSNDTANEDFAADSLVRNLGFKSSEIARLDLRELGVQNPSHALRQAAARAAEAKLLANAINSGGSEKLRTEIRQKYSKKPEVRIETDSEREDREAFEFLAEEGIYITRKTYDAELRRWATYDRPNTKVNLKWKEAQVQLLASAKFREQAKRMTEDSRETLLPNVLDVFEEAGGVLMEKVVANLKDEKIDDFNSRMLKRSVDLQRQVKGENSGDISYYYIDALSPQFIGAIQLETLFKKHNIPEGTKRVACTLAFIAGFTASYEGFSANRAISDWLTGVMPIDPPLNQKEPKEETIQQDITMLYERESQPTGQPRSLGLFWRQTLSHDYNKGLSTASVLRSTIRNGGGVQNVYDELLIAEKSNTAMSDAAQEAAKAAQGIANKANERLYAAADSTNLGFEASYAQLVIEQPNIQLAR